MTTVAVRQLEKAFLARTVRREDIAKRMRRPPTFTTGTMPFKNGVITRWPGRSACGGT